MSTFNMKASQKADVLIEILPYIKRFAGKTFVVKFGGSAMGDESIVENFARDVTLLKSCDINVIVVHGGGPQISAMLTRLGIKSEMIDGLRKTTKDMIDIVEMVLCGSINKQMVSLINKVGGIALGLSGKDANLIVAKKKIKVHRATDSNIERIMDLGYVGEPETINTEFFEAIEDTHIIPVIAPVGFDAQGNTYNINADDVAGAIAAALSAHKLILLTDTDGIMHGEGRLISSLTIKEAKDLMRENVITGGMIPKVETCIHALNHGVENVHIINGGIEHALLIEILTDEGIGTMIVQ